MSRKKRRRRPPGPRPADPPSVPAAQTPPVGAETKVRRSGNGSAAPRSTQPLIMQPPVLRSIGRGLVTVGRSPALLVSAFLGLLVLWLTYSLSGQVYVASPGTLSQLEALPVMHSLVDANFLQIATRVFEPPVILMLAAVLLIVRAALLSFWIAACLESLGGEADWRVAAAKALGPARRSFPTVLLSEATFLAIVFVLPSILGAILGLFGLVGGLVLGMYFLIYAPVVAVAEGRKLRDALQYGVRAARARGPQHTLLVFCYAFASLVLLFISFAGVAVPATPSVFAWAYALGLTAIHVGLLATLVDRWRSLRVPVIAAVDAQREARSAARTRRR
jgi:hypothetical protein